MFNLTRTFGYEVWNDSGLIGVSGFLKQVGSMLIFSDFSVEETEVKAIRRGW